MFNEFFSKKKVNENDREAVKVIAKGNYSLDDTFLCGQFFKYEEICREDGYTEYFIPVGNRLIFVGQKKSGELTLAFENDFFRTASEKACGIRILKQEPREAICSLIISQNNNIPRIRKIIRELSSAYGVNLDLQNNLKTCPIDKNRARPCI